ncbi:ATP-binding protein [Streptomyces sp. NPDC097640]|uniref:ATP-binding protein n=1 Tax=Streptomyces sp. NPDC097640 TaxID=3157229 RepID=UPI00331E3EF0
MMSHVNDGLREFRLSLVVKPSELPGVRRIVRAHLRLWGLQELIEDTLEIATELLTNVHRHAGGRAVLLLQRSPGLLRITVSDRSPRMPVVKRPDWTSLTGRGMFLVDALADEWKAVPTETGKDVCATLTLPSGRALPVLAELARWSV